MIDKNGIKAIAFDFGGTLDAPFLHWSDIYLKLYTHELGLPLTKETFWDSYVYAERQMESVRPVSVDSTLYDTQCFKILYQAFNLSFTWKKYKNIPGVVPLILMDYLVYSRVIFILPISFQF